MRKKLISVVLIAAMAATLFTACGKKGDNAETGNATPENASPTNTADTSSGEVINLDLWVFGGLSKEPEVFKKLADEFNASQDKIKVTVTTQEWGSRQEKIVTAFQGGDETAPDMYVLGPCIEEYGMNLGIISPLQEALPDIADQVKKLLLPEVADQVASRDGVLWTIPSWVDLSPYMMYNVEALKAIGLDENSVPKTWSEFKDAAIAMKEAGYVGYTIPMSMGNYSDVNNEFNYWNWQLGGSPISADGKTMTMNDEHAVTTVKYLNSLYEAGVFSENAANETYMDRHENFFGGVVATNIGYTYLNGLLEDMSVPEDFNYIMADMPVPDAGTNIDKDNAFYRMVSSNQEISISSITKNVEAVGEFLQFLIDKNYWHEWVTYVGARTPVDIASYEDAELRKQTEEVQPDLVRMYDEGTLMEGVKPKPSYGGLTEVQTVMAQYLADTIQGKYASVEEGLNALNEECQSVLDEYKE
ncbi:MAG TPA: extracellular solute-binding protein [Clostridiales bacterium]|nr:extracellular solute-binding protein [Clostridiales bacterium]